MVSTWCILAATAISLSAPALALQKELVPKPEEHGVKVEVRGVVGYGVVAIGGECTGVIITAGPVTWELELAGHDALLALAERLDGKTAVARGSLRRIRGVEVPERWIVTATHFKEAPPKEKDHFVDVEVRGLLKHRPSSAGGSSTGTKISAGRITWELDLGSRDELRAFAKKHDGKTVIARGRLKVQKGDDKPTRWIVTVDSMREAGDGARPTGTPHHP